MPIVSSTRSVHPCQEVTNVGIINVYGIVSRGKLFVPLSYIFVEYALIEYVIPRVV